MPTHTGTILGYAVSMLDTDDEITASYDDTETLLDEITSITQEAETIADAQYGDYEVLEQTEIDSEGWQRYWVALCDWVAGHTGIPSATLQEAWHPDCAEPYLQLSRD